jgi:branched-chain amino acid transport system substrate-binding protein
MSSSFNRRQVLKSIAAGAAAPLLATYGTLARAQGANIPIGLVIPFTGATGSYGHDMAEAGKRTLARINEAGGILGGRRLELFIEDSESSPTASVVASQKLIGVNKVVALTGFWGTPEALAVKPVALQNNMALLVSCSGHTVTEGDTKGLVWRFQAKSTDWGTTIARAMLKDGHRKVSVMALQNPFVQSMVKPFQETIKAGGGTIVDSIAYNPDQSSYRAEVEKVFGAKPQAVFAPGLLPDFSSIAREVYRAGFDTRIYTLSVAADAEGKFASNVGSQVAENIHHFQPSPDLKSAGYAKFQKMMNAPAEKLFLFAGNTHDQMCMLAMAMEKSKSTTPLEYTKQMVALANGPGEPVDDVVEALKLVRSGKPVNFAGAGSAVEFAPNGDQLNRVFGHYVIKGGKNSLVEVMG